MTLEHNTRYYMEQIALPKALFAGGSHFLNRFLISSGKAVRDCYATAEKANPEYTCPYTEADFEVHFRKYIGQDPVFLIVRLGMPEPEYPYLSRAIYLCCGDHGVGELYLTSELGADGNYYLCSLDSQDRRINFGPAPLDENEEMEKAASIYREPSVFAMLTGS